MTTRRPLVSLAATSLLSVVLLSGCGVSDTELRPGAAAVVGEERITVTDVDDRTPKLCALMTGAPQAGTEGVSYPLGQLRSALQRGLALNSLAEQIAEEYDVDVSRELAAGIDSVRSSFPTADPDELDAALPAFTGDGHLDLVLTAVGAQDLGAGADEAEVRARGYELGQEWVEENGLESNPLFDDLILGPEGVEAVRSELSIPAGDWARRAAAAQSVEEASAATAELPASQRCSS